MRALLTWSFVSLWRSLLIAIGWFEFNLSIVAWSWLVPRRSGAIEKLPGKPSSGQHPARCLLRMWSSWHFHLLTYKKKIYCGIDSVMAMPIEPLQSGGIRRIRQACANCRYYDPQTRVLCFTRWQSARFRRKKTKCSGERPICVHCRRNRLSCVYEPYSATVGDLPQPPLQVPMMPTGTTEANNVCWTMWSWSTKLLGLTGYRTSSWVELVWSSRASRSWVGNSPRTGMSTRQCSRWQKKVPLQVADRNTSGVYSKTSHLPRIRHHLQGMISKQLYSHHFQHPHEDTRMLPTGEMRQTELI